jgi:hypothetical protein
MMRVLGGSDPARWITRSIPGQASVTQLRRNLR